MSKEILTDWIAELKAADDANRQREELKSARMALASKVISTDGCKFVEQLERELRIQVPECRELNVLADISVVNGEEKCIMLQARSGFPAVKRAFANLFYIPGERCIRVRKTPDSDRIEEEESNMLLLCNHENQVAVYYEGKELTATKAATSIMRFLAESVR
jgi:hypothetical protein